jgi:peptidoglycan/LPS O-acetylase OafA/YrhL
MKSLALILNSIVVVIALILVISSGVQMKQVIVVFIFFFTFILNIVSLIMLINSGRSVFQTRGKRQLKKAALTFSTLLLILGMFSIINSNSPFQKQIAKAVLFFPTLIITIAVLVYETKDSILDLYLKKIFNRTSHLKN